MIIKKESFNKVKLITKNKQWTKFLINLFVFIGLALGTFFIPTHMFEQFLGIGLQKIIKIILALGAIQLLGVILSKWLNSSAGFIIHGFISGFISSTALTVSLAKRSNNMTPNQKSVESLEFVSATLAMLGQGLFLSLITVSHLDLKTMSLFLFPTLVTISLLISRTIHTKDIISHKQHVSLNWFSIAKLSIFICIILIMSSHVKIWLGTTGLQTLTFIISLFEIHGSIVASSQLFSNKSIDSSMFHSLIALSILASYVSKLVIIYIIGDSYFKRKVTLWVGLVLISLALAFWI